MPPADEFDTNDSPYRSPQVGRRSSGANRGEGRSLSNCAAVAKRYRLFRYAMLASATVSIPVCAVLYRTPSTDLAAPCRGNAVLCRPCSRRRVIRDHRLRGRCGLPAGQRERLSATSIAALCGIAAISVPCVVLIVLFLLHPTRTRNRCRSDRFSANQAPVFVAPWVGDKAANAPEKMRRQTRLAGGRSRRHLSP